MIKEILINGKKRFFKNGKEIILSDLDSTVLDYCTPWYKEYNKEYNDNLTIHDVHSWNTHEYVKPECGKKIYEYSNVPGIYRNLKPLPYAQEVFERLARDFEIFFVTDSPVGTGFEMNGKYGFANPIADKKANVAELFPFIPKENFIVTSEKYMVAGSFLLDDGPKNLINFHNTNRVAVAIDYAWNQGIDKEIPRVKSLLEFEGFIRDYTKHNTYQLA